MTFHIGDKVTVSIPKLDRSKTDVPWLPCVIAHVYGDKVKTYCLTTAYGTLKGKFRGISSLMMAKLMLVMLKYIYHFVKWL